MIDHVRFTRELIHLRRWQYPGVRGQGFRVLMPTIRASARVSSWLEGEDHDVIVVVNLATFNCFGYRIGFPAAGERREVFNSDI